jgi:hypothetical protein
MPQQGKVTLDAATAGATWNFKSQFNPQLTKNAAWQNGLQQPFFQNPFTTFGATGTGMSFQTGAAPNPAAQMASLEINPLGASLPATVNYSYSFLYGCNSASTPTIEMYILDGNANLVSNTIVLPANVNPPVTFNGIFNVILAGNNNLFLVLDVEGDGLTTDASGFLQNVLIYNFDQGVTNFKYPFSVSPSNPFFTIVIGTPDETDSGIAIIQFSNGGTIIATLTLPYGNVPTFPFIELGCSPPSAVKTVNGMNPGGVYTLSNLGGQSIIFDWSGVCDTVTITVAAGINSSGFKSLNNTTMGVLQNYIG